MPDRAEDDLVVRRFQRHYAATPGDPGAEARTIAALGRPRVPPSMVWRTAIAAMLLLLLGRLAVHTPATVPQDGRVPVRFAFETTAQRVSVVGDFNGWDPDATPMRRAGAPQRWEVETRLEAGRSEYAFVLDGRLWVPDPNAPLAP